MAFCDYLATTMDSQYGIWLAGLFLSLVSVISLPI